MTLKSGIEVTHKVIKTGTIRKLGCGFLFAFHSNYGAILYHLRDIATSWSKIANFLYLYFIFVSHLYLAPPQEVTLSEFREHV